MPSKPEQGLSDGLGGDALRFMMGRNYIAWRAEGFFLGWFGVTAERPC